MTRRWQIIRVYSCIYPTNMYWKSAMCRVGESNGNPLQYSCLENPMDRGAWWAAGHGVAKSQTRLSDFTFTFNGNPLQCSCLENPRDGAAWWADVYGVTQGQTGLKWLSSRSRMCRVYREGFEELKLVVMVMPSVNVNNDKSLKIASSGLLRTIFPCICVWRERHYHFFLGWWNIKVNGSLTPSWMSG